MSILSVDSLIIQSCEMMFPWFLSAQISPLRLCILKSCQPALVAEVHRAFVGSRHPGRAGGFGVGRDGSADATTLCSIMYSAVQLKSTLSFIVYCVQCTPVWYALCVHTSYCIDAKQGWVSGDSSRSQVLSICDVTQCTVKAAVREAE